MRKFMCGRSAAWGRGRLGSMLRVSAPTAACVQRWVSAPVTAPAPTPLTVAAKRGEGFRVFCGGKPQWCVTEVNWAWPSATYSSTLRWKIDGNDTMLETIKPVSSLGPELIEGCAHIKDRKPVAYDERKDAGEGEGEGPLVFNWELQSLRIVCGEGNGASNRAELQYKKSRPDGSIQLALTRDTPWELMAAVGVRLYAGDGVQPLWPWPGSGKTIAFFPGEWRHPHE